jgi:DNA-binding transcriptional LysR family regulator
MTTSTALGAIVRLATSGYGVCAIPRAVISSEISSGALVELKTDFSLPPISFTASYALESPMKRLLNDICKEVSDFLEPRLIKEIYRT